MYVFDISPFMFPLVIVFNTKNFKLTKTLTLARVDEILSCVLCFILRYIYIKGKTLKWKLFVIKKTCQWNVSLAECAELMGYLHSNSHMELALSSRRRVPSYHRSRFVFFSHAVHCDAGSACSSVRTRFLTQFWSHHSLYIAF